MRISDWSSDVCSSDLLILLTGYQMLNTLDLFAGIGGFALGLERTGGFRVAAFCEVDPDPTRTLKKNWPNVPVYGDVSGLTKEIMDADGITINVITGGFPCQDISFARTDRKNVVKGKSVSVRVDNGGLRIVQKQRHLAKKENK